MPIVGKLVEMYRSQGIDICTGLPCHEFYDLPSAPLTRFFKDGSNMTGGLGISMHEVYFLEHLFSSYRPPNVLVIGNSLGWSTLAIALLLPESQVVAMDAGLDENSLYGLDLTNRMAALAGLTNLRAVKGTSPQDVAAVVDSDLKGHVDFAFIDGLHTNQQIVLDFESISRKAAKDAVYLFHDVLAFYLGDGIRLIEALAGHAALALSATPSGMAVLYDPAQHPELSEAVAAFAPASKVRAQVKEEARRGRHYRRLRRMLRHNHIFIEAVNVIRRWMGTKPYSQVSNAAN